MAEDESIDSGSDGNNRVNVRHKQAQPQKRNE